MPGTGQEAFLGLEQAATQADAWPMPSGAWVNYLVAAPNELAATFASDCWGGAVLGCFANGYVVDILDPRTKWRCWNLHIDMAPLRLLSLLAAKELCWKPVHQGPNSCHRVSPHIIGSYCSASALWTRSRFFCILCKLDVRIILLGFTTTNMTNN